ncbi:hypothetical protein J7I80_08280 [Bacillus sp. ISL-41]|uniref:hypothetical protein n=1 Tax=Bacillus sp. ISL-41 TaxID=2819127 RepID=UPI001BEC8B83|nr:hypothetical protein [Bacillus sp. ISL-41]MBT2642219.1 hypothetical protein [Bacillus sp. ISL-41]
MNQIQTKIGDHYIKLISETEIIHTYINSRFKNIEGYFKEDLTIQITDGYGVPFRDYNVEIDRSANVITYQRADYLIEVDLEFNSAKLSVFDDLALKHALTNLYSAFVVHHNWGLLIHSSCVIDNGSAQIFAGYSGAGKSTAAKLSYPRTLLSDEATLVKIASDGIKVFNSPFRSELEAGEFDGNVDLKGVQILLQSLSNNRIKLAKSDALLQIMDKIFFWPTDQREINTIVRLLTVLVNKVPVYHLHFQKNNTFWELIK